MNPKVVPAGREFSSSVQAHHLWTRFQECGWCAVWDGSERGGFPAFVDTLASSLHPAVVFPTLIFGVINGAKWAVIITLWMAGLSQWWLGRVLRLGWLPRMWGAFLVVVGGHLSGRMELGTLCSIVSTVAVSLVFAPAIRLSQTGKIRDAIILAVVLALMAVSGQGYMQAGFIFLAPTFLILIIRAKVGEKLLWKRFFMAIGLGFLLAAPFLVPFIHFLPNFVKDGDFSFGSAQPMQYYLLNLLIDDADYFRSTALGHLPFPNLYTMFIGWAPVVLAISGLWMMRKQDRRPLLFLAIGAVLALWFGTAQPLHWIKNIIPWVTSLRFISITGGLAVSGIVALAAYAVDKILKLDWPRLALVFSSKNKPNLKGVNLSILLLIPLVMNVHKGYAFSQVWYFTERMDENIYKVLDALETDDLQWVQPPFGEHFYIEDAVHRQMKLSPGIMTWRWKGREFPQAVLMASHTSAPEPYEEIDEIGGTKIFERDDLMYASIVNDSETEACVASGRGGKLTVKCDPEIDGRLVVQENTWSGWKAWLDGEPVSLVGEQWLEVEAPAGEHIYEFRYLPWDVPLGLALSFLGIFLCVWLWFFHSEDKIAVREKNESLSNRNDIS